MLRYVIVYLEQQNVKTLSAAASALFIAHNHMHHYGATSVVLAANRLCLDGGASVTPKRLMCKI